MTQDWMCEGFILAKTGKSVREHQLLTTEGYSKLRELSRVYIMPVLQGYRVEEYLEHLEAYGKLLEPGVWVGVGSVCKRNTNPDAIEDVLVAIKRARPDLRLHGFGLKIQALERPTVRALLASSDSMAWSYEGRRNGDSNDPRRALRYVAKVEEILKGPCLVQEQLFCGVHGANGILPGSNSVLGEVQGGSSTGAKNAKTLISIAGAAGCGSTWDRSQREALFMDEGDTPVRVAQVLSGERKSAAWE